MSIGPHHTIIFDTIKTDTHGNYNNYTGAFSIPVGGVYVFTWSIRGDGAQSFELVKNADVLDALYFTGNNIQLGKSFVGKFNENDVVFIRTHDTYAGSGDILSNTHGYTSFSGYRIKQ